MSSSDSHKCSLVLAGVEDERLNPESFGTVNHQTVYSSDPTGWIHRGFEALARDPRIIVQDNNSSHYDLALHVGLLKAYVANVTSETRSVNVVIRVRYESAQGVTQEEIYRGTDGGLTWGGGQGESQTSFNVALMQIVDAVHRDVVFHCG